MLDCVSVKPTAQLPGENSCLRLLLYSSGEPLWSVQTRPDDMVGVFRFDKYTKALLLTWFGVLT